MTEATSSSDSEQVAGHQRMLGLLLAAALCAGAVVARSFRHPAPVLEPGLFRSRTFSGAGAALVLYYAAFGAFLLNTVEFLTTVWR